MIQITVSAPEHSKKDYIMLIITKALREAGAEVALFGEETYLAEKVDLDSEKIESKIKGLKIRVSELRTGV